MSLGHWMSAFKTVLSAILTVRTCQFFCCVEMFINGLKTFSYFLLKDNCFIEFYFLSNLNMNQP